MQSSDHMKQIEATSGRGQDLIFENKSKHERNGLEIKKMGVVFAKSSHVVLDTSRRLQVDLGSLWYH